MRLITDVLRDIRRGKAVEQATEALNEIVRAVDSTGKKGTLTLEFEVQPAKDGSNEKLIRCSVKAKKPMAEIPPAIFFSDDDGDLHRTDPNQSEMEFEEVRSREQA